MVIHVDLRCTANTYPVPNVTLRHRFIDSKPTGLRAKPIG
jgi:hypothetical protein